MPDPLRRPPTPAERTKRRWTAVGAFGVAVLVLTTGYRISQSLNRSQQRRAADEPPFRLKILDEKAAARDAFLSSVVGKSKPEVRAAYGPPAREANDGREWVYAQMTYGTNRRGIFIDPETTVRFDAAGIATEVDFPAGLADPDPRP